MKNLKKFEQFKINNAQTKQMAGGTYATFTGLSSLNTVATSTLQPATDFPPQAITIKYTTGNCWNSMPLVSMQGL